MTLLAPTAAQASHLPPDPNYVPYEPALSNEERGVLGLINDERARNGVAPLPMALPLTDAADRYVNYLVATGQFGHNYYGTPSDRVRDAGWPSRFAHTDYVGASETLYWGSSSAHDAFEGWMNSPPHHSILMSNASNAIGIAQREGVWAVVLSFCPLGTERESACRMTDDIGDASLASESGPGDVPDGSEDDPVAAKLRLKAKRRGRRALLTFTLPRGDGGLQLVASKAGKERTRTLAGAGKVKTKLRLARGRWVIEATSDSASVCRVLNMKRQRAKQASRHWVKVKTRPC